MRISIKGYNSVENFGRKGVGECAEIEIVPVKGDFFTMNVLVTGHIQTMFLVNGYEMRAILKAIGFMDNMVHVNARVEVKT